MASIARGSMCKWGSGSTSLYRVGVLASQLDLPFPTPLSVAGCGRLKPGAAHWATSTGMLLAIEDFDFKGRYEMKEEARETPERQSLSCCLDIFYF